MDTWDLKPDSEKNGGPFKPIATSAPGVKISEHLPNVAKQMKHLSIIRSLDSKEGNHDRGTYMMHTGYAPNPTVVHPASARSARTSWARSSQNFDLPHCISINTPGQGAGFLGHVALAVRGAEPERPDRQPAAPRRTSTTMRMTAGSRCSAWSRRTSSAQKRGPGRRRPQGRLRQDAPDDELALHPGASTSTTSPPRSATPTAGARSARAA